MLVFFFPFFWKSRQLRIRQHERARTVLFLKGISAAIFSLRSCTACARVLSLCMRLPARARGCPRRLLLSRPLGGSTAKWTNVVWPIKSRQTNQQTNKHTLLFYRYRCHPDFSEKQNVIILLLQPGQQCSFTNHRVWFLFLLGDFHSDHLHTLLDYDYYFFLSCDSL